MTWKTKIRAGVFVILAGGLAYVGTVNFIRARNVPAQNACVNNLRQIDGAKQTWALEHSEMTNRPPTWNEIQPYLGRGTAGSLPSCPANGIYTLGRIGEPPRFSFGGTHVLE